MRKFFMIAAFVLGSLVHGAVLAQDATTPPTDYREVMRTCGAEWRASEARKAVPKGEGMAAWQAFRKDCVAKSGFKSKRERRAAQ